MVFVKQARERRHLKLNQSLDHLYDESVMLNQRQDLNKRKWVYTEEYDLKGVPVEIPVIIFKDGERLLLIKLFKQ